MGVGLACAQRARVPRLHPASRRRLRSCSARRSSPAPPWRAAPNFVAGPFSTTAGTTCFSGDALGAPTHTTKVAQVAPGPLADPDHTPALGEGRKPEPEPILVAAREFEARGQRPEAARMLLTEAEVMAEASGETDGTAELAGWALRLYGNMDSESLALRAQSLLRRLDRHSRDRGSAGWDRLPIRGSEVLGRLSRIARTARSVETSTSQRQPPRDMSSTSSRSSARTRGSTRPGLRSSLASSASSSRQLPRATTSE